MESPDTVDAKSYAETLKLLGDLMPAMPAPARSRAAWAVARSRLDLAAAVRVEGFSLHGATAAATARATPTTPLAAPAAPRAVASRADLADLQRAADSVQRARLEGRISPAGAAAVSSLASSKTHDAAVELRKRNPSMTYRAAVEAVSRVTP